MVIATWVLMKRIWMLGVKRQALNRVVYVYCLYADKTQKF
jgi:hypothetical protein